jgi:cytochrome d ubiquinol oxidase subunit I
MTFAGWVATLAGWYCDRDRPPALAGQRRADHGAGRRPGAGGQRRHDAGDVPTLYAVLLVAYIATLYRLAAKGRIVEHLPGNVPLPARA